LEREMYFLVSVIGIVWMVFVFRGLDVVGYCGSLMRRGVPGFICHDTTLRPGKYSDFYILISAVLIVVFDIRLMTVGGVEELNYNIWDFSP